MILLTRLNGVQFYLNVDLIESVEETPDTIVRLRDKNYCLVQEPMKEVARKVLEYRRLTHGVDKWIEE